MERFERWTTVNSCCCFDLRSGTLVIANLRLFFSFISLLISILYLTHHINISLNFEFAVYLIRFTALIIIITIILVVGVIQDKPNLILIHQVINGAMIVSYLIDIITTILDYTFLLVILLSLVFQAYFWVVIQSYYRSRLLLQPQEINQVIA
nr:uncharacterized protein LOC111415307 [Onthophagus taurus]